jgi:hypothetical protein
MVAMAAAMSTIPNMASMMPNFGSDIVKTPGPPQLAAFYL